MTPGLDLPLPRAPTLGQAWLDRDSLTAVVKAERQVVLIRWLGIVCAAALGPLLFHGRELLALEAVCAISAVYNLAFSRLIIPRWPALLRQGHLTTAGDTVLSGSVIYFTGGLHSEFFLVYFLIAVVSAVRFGFSAALLSTGLALTTYLGVVFATGAPRTLQTLATVCIRVAFAATTGVFVGFLGDRAHAAEKELERATLQARHALADATAALTRSLDLGEVLRLGAELTTTLAGAQRAELTTEPPAELREWLDLADRQRRLPTAAAHEAAPGPGGQAYEVPVHYGGERVGLLRLVLPAGDAGLDPVRQTLIETFAERCGPALANAWTYAAMELQALVDATTGLANHRRFKDYLSDLEREAGRRHEPLSVLMVDLDMFKEFNDTFGHLAGDRALRRVGRILSECVGDGGLTARYGGDEFVAVLPATDSHRAGEIAQAVLERFRQALAEGTDGLAPPVGLSIGRATATVSEADYQTLVGRADLAMYLAKRAGGGVRAFEDLGDDHPLRALVGSIMAQLTKVDLSALGEGRLGPRSPRRAHASRRAGPSRTAEVVRTLVVAMRTKDPALYTHCRNVARLCFRMARRLGLNAWETYDVGLAGLLHDIGKICVPDGILQRPGRLSDAEMEVVRRRAVQGADILAAVPTLVSVSLAVRHHHENFDGSGYPAGLAGDDIPLPARIVLAADAFDAMISDRPYRKGRTPAEALRILREGAGQQFDPRVVSTLTTLLAELGMAAPRAATVHAHGAGNTPTAALEASSA